MRNFTFNMRVKAVLALFLAVVGGSLTTVGASYSTLGTDRLLLANDDIIDSCPVSGQGYDSTAWTRVNEREVEDVNYNLMPGTEFYFNPSGENLWHLKNVRLGNTFNVSGNVLGPDSNYLPWKNDTAMAFTNSASRARSQRDAGQIVMINADDPDDRPRIVSPLYSSGIGRIYFDAVNFSTATPNYIALYVSTNGTTEADAEWQRALVDVVAITNGVVDVASSLVALDDNITLAMTAGGSTGNFYRIMLNDPKFVNYRGPARFKIERNDHDGEKLETSGMVIVDNVICSYPAGTATLIPGGTFESELTGEQVVGWSGTFLDAPMPRFGVTGLKPVATVERIVPEGAPADEVTVSDATFHYRWRYLAQQLIGGTMELAASSVTATSSQAKLSGATLDIPAVDATFTNRTVRMSAIVLGNTSYDTAGIVQYIEVNGTRSKRLNGDGVYSSRGKHPDGSWILRYDFDPVLEVRTETKYDIKFFDQYGTEISEAPNMRVVNPSALADPSLVYAVRVKDADLAKPNYNRNYTHFLAKVEGEHDGGFLSVDMTETDGELVGEPIDDSCSALPGDIEYYYTANVDAPYYRYVDFTGLDVEWIDEDFERLATMLARRSTTASRLASGGTDYFTRLRDGESDLKRFDVEMRATSSSSATAEYYGTIVGDLTWNAFMPAVTNSTKGVCQVRFRTVDKNNTTNYLHQGDWSYSKWPDTINGLSTITSGDNAWFDIEYGEETGYLRFQYVEDDGMVMISRADFQNFNGWSDANLGEETFVGSSTDADSLRGVSNAQKTYSTYFDGWAAMSATSDYWTEKFPLEMKSETKPDGYELYKHFNKGKTPQGLQAHQGQWTHAKYKTGTAYALQLDGGGKGSLEFVNAAETPRGIGTVSYTARLAQAIDFDDFIYCLSDDAVNSAYGNPFAATNYTFGVRAVMGYLTEKHDGTASLSLVAYYHPSKGCYEFRVTNCSEGNHYNLELYRWTVSGRKVSSTLLGSKENISAAYAFDVDIGNGNFRFPAIFISADSSVIEGATHIVAGIQKNGTCALAEDLSGRTYNTLIYNDADSARLTAGSCGVTSANCPARFARPQFFTGHARGSADTKNNIYPWTDLNQVSYNQGQTVNMEGTVSRMYDSLHGGFWDSAYNRMEPYNVDKESEDLAGTNWGLKCADLEQEIILGIAASGSNDFIPVATNTISSFALEEGSFDVYWPADASLEVRTGNEEDVTSADIVLSYFSFTQWRGDDYTSDTGYFGKYGTTGAPMTIAYTTAWVHETTNEEEEVVHPHSVELSASRAATNGTASVVSLRSPLFDGETSLGIERGTGLGMIAFSYTNCNENVNLLLQIATNDTALTSVRAATVASADDTTYWTTVTNFVGSARTDGIPLKSSSGVASYYLGLHGVKGMMRIVMDPETVKAAAAARNGVYGSIFITQILFRDDPEVSTAAWWGWNLRTGGFLHERDDCYLQYLADGSTVNLEDFGQSVALNNSVTENVAAEDLDEYPQHLPFLQTPTFVDTGDGTPTVGELSFKARRYDNSPDVTARVTVYGATDANANDSMWRYVTHFDVGCDVFTNFTYRTTGSSYRAYRLAVIGVPGANGMNGGEVPDNVVRVVIDNVSIAETIVPRLGFKNIMAFRSGLDTLDQLDYADRESEQPLAGEDWGIQAEVYATALSEEIDFDRGITVRVYYLNDQMPWGYENWAAAPAGVKELVKCEDCAEGEYIFRSSFKENPSSIFAATTKSLEIVQYMLSVTYYLKDSETPVDEQFLNVSGEWVKPEWYLGVDYNKKFAGMNGKSAYTILDAIAPGWAWINEVNAYGEDTVDSVVNIDQTNQYIEVAIPAAQSIEGWHLDVITLQGHTNTIVRFTDDDGAIGSGYAKASKTKNITQGFAFLNVASPRSLASLNESAGERDGIWKWTAPSDGDFTFSKDGTYNGEFNPVAIQLVRASDVIEEQVVLGGTDGYEAIARRSGTPSAIAWEYSTTNMVRKLTEDAENQGIYGTKWFSVGYDNGNKLNSLSVTNSNGSVEENWSKEIVKTPGSINAGQVLPGDPPTPSGASVIIYCEIDPDSAAYLKQTVGDATETTDTVMVLVQKGSEFGTNITYKVGNYFEIDSVTTNTVALAEASGRQGTVEINVGKGVSNAVYVVASARPWSELTKSIEDGGYGLTENNAYTPAVLDWLVAGKRLDGSSFANSDGEIRLAKFHSYNGNFHTNLDVTTMYWFDMDPTVGGLHLTAGMKDLTRYNKSVTEKVTADGPSITRNAENALITIYMAVTNENDAAEIWSPYVLRGLEPGSNSQDLSGGAWTSVTFKVTAMINNGYKFNVGFIPVRWFVFSGNGRESTSFDAAHCSVIDIPDQRLQGTPGAYEGWDEFWNLSNSMFYRWRIDGNMRPQAPSVLKPKNYIYYEEPTP